MSNLGLTELAANTPQQFASITVELASDLPRLEKLRGSLRSRMLSSPLTDARQFARDIDNAYRQLWRRSVATSGG